ncbi:hypothetical protein A9Q68_01860 [Streptococcus bovimastitidis]|uniref:RpiR family transcriptional regulator n=1 Tax=Streptococcus bovimastitidis TaxID=1856638 RepID=A0A1L8MNF7_9STRE|nr:MurR/RpiR family transcriptional regulator [Streptococcus bovimastitidis]OJF72314.1 hypothetical protein A9Q68_01860 [Streptococcus bovimastitidis]
MNIYEKLLTIKLSANEKAIKDLIFADSPSFIKMSINTICKKAFVSRSTLYRFCDKLGVTGFSDLKLRLQADLEHYQKTVSHFNIDYPIQSQDSLEKMLTNMHEVYGDTVQSTVNLMDLQVLNRIAKQINQADRTLLFTSAGNIFFAENFKFQLAEIGKRVEVPKEDYYMSWTAASSREEDFAIVISFGGRSHQMGHICKLLKENQTKILLICSPEAESLFDYADHILYMSPKENHYQKISSFSTRLSLLFILDLLYTTIFKEDYDANKDYKTSTYQKMIKRD